MSVFLVIAKIPRLSPTVISAPLATPILVGPSGIRPLLALRLNLQQRIEVLFEAAFHPRLTG
ncbi:hypothetical protein, partial [Rhizobium leguminosarum]|uniref:hypothetical protein n=1 Tax=Rhizobium leguminosarum TaxID=384 RepID=UPI003F983687